eukprot:3778988-Pleurochrysis_carterae.AAC.2
MASTMLNTLQGELGVVGVLALQAVILLEHGEALKIHLVKVFAPLALVDLAGLTLKKYEACYKPYYTSNPCSTKW